MGNIRRLRAKVAKRLVVVFMVLHPALERGLPPLGGGFRSAGEGCPGLGFASGFENAGSRQQGHDDLVAQDQKRRKGPETGRGGSVASSVLEMSCLARNSFRS